MSMNRFLLIILATVAAAGLTFFVLRSFEPVDTGIAVDGAAPVSIPWPTPLSASPLTSTDPTPVSTPADARVSAILADLNEYRVGLNVPALRFDASLAALAQAHADDMAAHSYLDHVTPEGVTFQERLDASGYRYVTAAENLGFASQLELVAPDWIQSPGHRANIENVQFMNVGIAIAQGTWQGVAVTYVTAVFARPR